MANSAQENVTNFCKSLNGKLLFRAFCYEYMVTLNELKAVLKVSAQAGQSGAVNKTSVESKAQDDEVEMDRACRMHWAKRNVCRILVGEPEG
jgi:hypothetical protein